MSFEKEEREPQPSIPELPSTEHPEIVDDRPYADHPVVALGEEKTIILGEN